jgi:hypothetical protein
VRRPLDEGSLRSACQIREGVIMTVNETAICIQHHFGDWGRCAGCHMQTRYYQEGMAALSKWTKKEIETDYEHYLKVKKNYEECKPHSHTSRKE